MDQNRFKQVKSKRGFTYSYYFSAPREGKPTVFFSHGFPTPAYLWREQITALEPLGYGIIAPDLLGYGGTDKPTEPKFYIGSGLAQDAIDILDNEKIGRVITVSHDWGSRVVSRMANYYPDRLVACAFFGVGYGPPTSEYADPITQSAQIKQMVGYDLLAYMGYFIQSEAPAFIEKNFDSFLSLLFPQLPETWKNHMCTPGGAKAWIESNNTEPAPDKEYYRTALLSGGMTAPLCWYKVLVEKCNHEDDAKISPEARILHKPILFVAFKEDPIGLPIFGDMTHNNKELVKGTVTRKEVDGDHWAVVSHAAELNGMLQQWIQGLNI
ncbi:alpha/beta-hydrolase [Mycena rosella]|uniref:Alpha/beta-hydrolase n=1 Tax=Mycena rosella TaxID=1033263 RepID=A0AAD7CTT4_MYCRO|nr:alpha/beta-hydrolase [Mycena rosella]